MGVGYRQLGWELGSARGRALYSIFEMGFHLKWGLVGVQWKALREKEAKTTFPYPRGKMETERVD